MAKVKTQIDESFVAENIRQIVEKLGVSATIEVSSENNVFFVDIASEDSALLIGKYGANLDSLQFVLAVRLKTESGEEDFEVYIDINGWRRQKEEKLKNFASSIAQKVIETGSSESLFDLSPSERRVIHMTLDSHPQVITESEGEGRDRHLVVKPK